MDDRLVTPLVFGLFFFLMSITDLQAQNQFLHFPQVKGQIRNFISNRFGAKKAVLYPPVPPGRGKQELPGDGRNFIPNRFDIPASIVDRKPGASTGCVGISPCGLVPPAPPSPAFPMPPAYPAPAAYAGYPPQNTFQGMPQVPYGPQRFSTNPAMATNGYNPNFLAQNTNAAVTAKVKLFGGIKQAKKFVPHLPSMGRHQPGKPPFNPPPPPPEPQAVGYGQAGQVPYQQPLSYSPQGMALPLAAGLAPKPAAGFAPPPVTASQQQTPFAPQQPQPGYGQVAPPMGAQQHDEPQLIASNTPQMPPPQVPFSPETNQGPAFNDPGQQMPFDGSFDMAKKRMVKGQMKRYGVPRPVLKSRLVPKLLFKRHN